MTNILTFSFYVLFLQCFLLTLIAKYVHITYIQYITCRAESLYIIGVRSVLSFPYVTITELSGDIVTV